MKRCPKCKAEKPVDEFHRDKYTKDGRKSLCKECVREYSRAYRKANREQIAEYDRAYNKANREKRAEGKTEYNRRYYAANHEQVLEQQREYRNAHRKARAAYNREYSNAQPGGVYRLVCVPTGDVYFGSAENLQNRKSVHFHHLHNGTHTNPTIRELSKLHPPEAFKFETLVLCDIEEARYYEQKLIEIKPCCNVHNTDGTRR